MQTNTNKSLHQDFKKHFILGSAFLFLLIAGAKIDLDVGGNISFTLQTLVLGLAYYYLPRNSRFGLIFTYLFLGIIGLPVFNGGAGWAYLISWPLGFFIGFVVSGFLQSPTDNSYWLLILVYFLLLHAVIVGFGVTWLAIYANSAYNGLETAFELLPGAIIKSGLGVANILLLKKGRQISGY
jgi:biotin transport system substrate-specific component